MQAPCSEASRKTEEAPLPHSSQGHELPQTCRAGADKTADVSQEDKGGSPQLLTVTRAEAKSSGVTAAATAKVGAKRSREPSEKPRSQSPIHHHNNRTTEATTPEKAGKKARCDGAHESREGLRSSLPLVETVSPTKRASIAPVVTLLGAVAARVHAAWTRIGVPRRDCEGRWNGFLQHHLSPYIEDFLTVNEAEERNMAAENDQLLRDVFFLCERLEEPCRHAGLAHVVETIRRCTSSSTSASWRTRSDDERESSATVAEECSEGHRRNSGETMSDSVRSASTGDEEWRDVLTMPSFTSFFLPTTSDEEVVACGGEGGEESNRSTAKLPTKMAASQDPLGGRAGDAVRQSAASAAAAKAIKAAIAQLCGNATHQEIQSLLQREFSRLDKLADYRLQLLCVLHKQRVLMQRPPAEQAVVRAAYAEAYLGPAAALPLGDRSKDLGSGGANADRSSASTGRSYHSALSSMKNSTRMTLQQVDSAADNAEAAAAAAAAAAAEEELHLFLAASPVKASVELRGTSFWLKPRPTAAVTAAPKTGGHDSKTTSGEGEVGPLQREEETEEAKVQVRKTVFDVDLSDVLQYGKRQNMSLRRVHREAGELLCLIAEQNSVMGRQAQEELDYIRELFAAPDATAALRPWQLTEIERRVQELRSSYEAESAAREKLSETSSAPPPPSSAVSSASPSSSALPSCRGTRSTTAFAGDDGAAALPETAETTTLHLPAAVRRIFTALSYAPILYDIQTTRQTLQRTYWHVHLSAAQEAMQALLEAYAAYYAQTKDPAYAKPPNFDHWLAEHADFTVDSSPSTGTPLPLGRSRLSLAEHVAAADALAAQVQQELAVLRGRLSLLDKVAPLLASRHALLAEQRALQEGSRERLLSKKVNMAKQLLHEEMVRKRMARELPRIMTQLEEMLGAWDALILATPSSSPGSCPAPAPPPELRVDGQSVRELLKQHRENMSNSSGYGATAPSSTHSTNYTAKHRLASLPPTPSASHQRSRSHSITPPPPGAAPHTQTATHSLPSPKTATSAATSHAPSRHPSSLHSGPISRVNPVPSRSVSPVPAKPVPSSVPHGLPRPPVAPHPGGHAQRRVVADGPSRSRTPPLYLSQQQHQQRSVSATKSRTPPPTARNPLTAAAQRHAVTRAAVGRLAGPPSSVFDRLSPTPKEKPDEHERSADPAPMPSSLHGKGCGGNAGLKPCSASAANAKAPSAFAKPGKYKPSLRPPSKAKSDSEEGPHDAVIVSLGESALSDSRTQHSTALATLSEILMSPTRGTAADSQQGQSEAVVATSLSRDLADAANGA